DLVEARLNLGVCLLLEGRASEAVEVLSIAAQLAPDRPAVHNNLGMALRDLGLIDEAIAAFRRTIAIIPGALAAWDNLLYASLYHPGYDAAAIFAEDQQWARVCAESVWQKAAPYAAHAND